MRRSTPTRTSRHVGTGASWLGTVAFLGLVALHLPRLVVRLRDASIVEPGVLLRWLLVPVVLAAFVALRRRRVSLRGGRAGLALWLLVLLIHAAPVTADGRHALDMAAPAAVTAWVVLGVLAALWARGDGGRRTPRRVPREFRLPASPRLAFAGFSPRPPPAS